VDWSNTWLAIGSRLQVTRERFPSAKPPNIIPWIA
jgi:hypothetical protein